MKLSVQRHLENLVAVDQLSPADALATLTRDYAISVKDYPEDGIVLLDYNQIDSPKAHPFVIECRSLILNRTTFELVSRKFNRFFNLGECPEYYVDFNFKTSYVMEKADGSLIGLYHNPITSNWELSTRGLAKAEGQHPLGGTFRERVLSAFGFSSEEAFQQFCNVNVTTDTTIVFEYCSHENRIVTRYDRHQMVITGSSCSGYEGGVQLLQLYCDMFKHAGLNVRMPKMYDATSQLSELVEVANALPDLQEGFVVWDVSSGKRVKIKASTYIVAHRLRGNDTVPTRKNLLLLCFEGEISEFLVYFPEWTDAVRKLETEISDFISEFVDVWDDVKDIPDQKSFALRVKDYAFSGIMFESRKASLHPYEVFKKLDINKKLRLFGA